MENDGVSINKIESNLFEKYSNDTYDAYYEMNSEF